MHVAQVSVRRKFNLGNYETEDIEIQMYLNEGEKASEAIDMLRDFINQKKLQNQQRSSGGLH